MRTLIFLSSLLYGVVLDFFGAVSIGEVLMALACLTYAAFRPGYFVSRNASVLMAFLGLISVQLVADLVNQTDVGSAVKGVGAYVLVLLVTAFAVYVVGRRKSDFRIFVVFSAASICFYLFFGRISGGFGSVWKSYFAYIFAIAVLFFLSDKKETGGFNSTSFAFFFFLCAIVSLFNDFRSAAVIFFCVPFLQSNWFRRIWAQRLGRLGRHSRLVSILGLAFVLYFSDFVGTFVARNAIESGYVGAFLDEAQIHKYRAQVQGEYGLILGGRSEFVGAITAFMDKPVFGHGSWPVDDSGRYGDVVSSFLDRSGYETVGPEGDNSGKLIPTHSHVLQGFVWAGVLGGVGWLFVLVEVVRRFLQSYSSLVGRDGYVVTFCTLVIVWNVLFSPFGYVSRVSLELLLAVHLVTSSRCSK